MSVATFRGLRQSKSKFCSKIFIYAWIVMFDPSKHSSWQTTLTFEVKQTSFEWKCEKKSEKQFWIFEKFSSPPRNRCCTTTMIFFLIFQKKNIFLQKEVKLGIGLKIFSPENKKLFNLTRPRIFWPSRVQGFWDLKTPNNDM